MGRKRKRDKWSNFDYFMFALLFPFALVCAFPILLVPIVIVVLLGLMASIIRLVEQVKSIKNKKKMSGSIVNIQTSPIKNEVKENIVVNRKVVEDKNHSCNNTFSFNEILRMCDDMEDKLLEVEIAYADMEEDLIELDSLYFELEEYDSIIDEYRNKKLVDLNDELLGEVREAYDKFLELYDDFNLLTSDDAFEHVKAGDKISISDAMVAGAVGYSIYKNRKKAREEKEKEKYREELRNTWGLSKYEIDMVESGEYEPSQFSEEELEDDDYYNENE